MSAVEKGVDTVELHMNSIDKPRESTVKVKIVYRATDPARQRTRADILTL